MFISVALLGIFCGNKELGIYMGSGLPSSGHNYSEVHLTYEKELILRQKFFILDGNFFANLMAKNFDKVLNFQIGKVFALLLKILHQFIIS